MWSTHLSISSFISSTVSSYSGYKINTTKGILFLENDNKWDRVEAIDGRIEGSMQDWTEKPVRHALLQILHQSFVKAPHLASIAGAC